MRTEVVSATALPTDAITELLDRSTAVTCYHSAAWLASLRSGFGYRDASIAAIRGGDVVGYLPILERRDLGGRLEWISLPFSHRVPLSVQDGSAARDLTDFASRLSGLLVVRDEVAVAQTGQKVDSGSVAASVDLRDGYRAVASRFSDMARRGVRKAEREQVQVEPATSLAEVNQFYKLLVETRRRQGVPVYPRRFLYAVWSNFGHQGGQLWLARHQSEVIAGLWLLLSRGHALYAFGASRSAPALLRLRPNNLLFDRVIAALCDAGYQQLDLGSAHRTNTGLIAFKQAWGAKLEAIFWRVWTHRRGFAAATRTGLAYRAASSAFRKAPLPLYKFLSGLVIGRLG